MPHQDASRSDDPRPDYSVRAVHRVADILDAVGRARDGVTLTGVAGLVGMPKSTTLRYLGTLRDRGYTHYDESTHRYRVGPALLGAVRGHDAESALAAAAAPVLRALRDELSETTNLGVLDGTMVRHLVVCESPHRMRLAARVGERAQLHSTALGKVVLGRLDDRLAEAILASADLPHLTAYGSREELLAAVRADRERGFAVDDQENQADGRCVAVPLVWSEASAAISVSAPDHRLPRSAVPGIVERLQQAAEAISSAHGSRTDPPPGR